MKITVDEILDFLKDNSINYKMNQILDNKEFIIASIFEIISNGFYYFVGEELPKTVKDSLILTNKDVKNNMNNNYILKIDAEPQMVYYKLMNSMFAEKSNGVIKESVIIHPEAKIGKNVQIDDYCIIKKCIIEDNVIIKSHCVIEDNTVIKKNTIIENFSNIGARGMAWVWDGDKEDEKIILPQLGGVIIEENCILGANSIIVRGSLNENTIIGKGTIMAPGCKIGHGTKIGKLVHFANNIATGGNTIIGDYSFIGSGAITRPKVKLHNHTIVGAGAVVVKNTTQQHQTLAGVPAKIIKSKNNPSGIPKLKNI